MFEFIVFFLGFGVLIGAIPCLVVWWLTKKLPTWLRLLIVTFVFALAATPIGGAGEGGFWLMPMGLVLISILWSLVMGVYDGELHDLLTKYANRDLFLLVWGIAYLISMIVVGICYFKERRNAKHAAYHSAGAD